GARPSGRLDRRAARHDDPPRARALRRRARAGDDVLRRRAGHRDDPGAALMPPELREDELDLARWLRPGDGVVAGQACAEPTVLVDALLEQAPSIGRLRAFFGLTWRDSVPEAASGALEVTSYGALGRLGRVDGLRVVPCHFSALPALLAAGALPGDVAFVQVAPPDAQGRCSLGVGALPEAIMRAVGGHRELGVHSGMISDGVLDLIEAGVVTNARKPADRNLTVTGAALGSRRLFEALGRREEIVFRPVSSTHAPA